MLTTSHQVRPNRLLATLQITALGGIALAAVHPSAPLAAQSPGAGPERLVVAATLDGGLEAPHLVLGNARTLKLEADPDQPLLWSAAFGDAGQVTVVYVGPERPARLRLDVDGDEETDLDTQAEPEAKGRGVLWKFPSALPREITPLDLTLRLLPSSAAPSLLVAPDPAHYLHGTIQLDGQELVVMLADLDIDGVFGTARDGWRAMPTSDMDRLLSRSDRFGFSDWTMMRVDEPCFVGDKVLRVDAVDGRNIELTATTGGDDLSSYLRRRHQRVNDWWRERSGERWSAPGEPGPDGEPRPRTDQPIEWLDVVDLAPALARARQLNRPVFLHLEAAESRLTQRLDEAVYDDAAVADLLRRHFVPVRLHLALAIDDMLARYGIEALPAMPILLPDGKQLRTEGGPVVFRPVPRHANSPSWYATRLEAAHQIWSHR